MKRTTIFDLGNRSLDGNSIHDGMGEEDAKDGLQKLYLIYSVQIQIHTSDIAYFKTTRTRIFSVSNGDVITTYANVRRIPLMERK